MRNGRFKRCHEVAGPGQPAGVMDRSHSQDGWVCALDSGHLCSEVCGCPVSFDHTGQAALRWDDKNR